MQKLQIRVGERLKILRKYKGYTQGELGEKVDLPQSYIGGIERGEKNISLETLEKLIQALDIGPEEVFASMGKKAGVEKDKLVDKISLLLRTRNLKEVTLVHNLINDLLKVIDSPK